MYTHVHLHKSVINHPENLFTALDRYLIPARHLKMVVTVGKVLCLEEAPLGVLT